MVVDDTVVEVMDEVVVLVLVVVVDDVRKNGMTLKHCATVESPELVVITTLCSWQLTPLPEVIHSMAVQPSVAMQLSMQLSSEAVTSRANDTTLAPAKPVLQPPSPTYSK